MKIKVENNSEVIDTEMLVLLPFVSASQISRKDVANILKEDWYEDGKKHLYMVYNDRIDIENDPIDSGIVFSEDIKFNKVKDDLKRFDGEIFYHS